METIVEVAVEAVEVPVESASPEPENLSFEGAMARLEELVASLEGGDLGLEASIDAYEEGLQLARACIERLDKAELRVQQLSENSFGTPLGAPEAIDN
jgi:exodeoxyribonuclease VII small subunit